MISLSVTNTGKREGDEVVQLYVHAASDTNKLVLPIKQLVTFDRIHLLPGETRAVKFELSHAEKALCYWDESLHAFVPVKGFVELAIGSSSEDIRLKGRFQMGQET